MQQHVLCIPEHTVEQHSLCLSETLPHAPPKLQEMGLGLNSELLEGPYQDAPISFFLDSLFISKNIEQPLLLGNGL